MFHNNWVIAIFQKNFFHLYGHIEFLRPYWILAAILVLNLKYFFYFDSQPNRNAFQTSYRTSKYVLYFLSYSNYSEGSILNICQSVRPFEFWRYIVTKIGFVLNLNFSSIGIPYTQAIEQYIMFDSFRVMAIFLNILYFFGHFEFLPPYW